MGNNVISYIQVADKKYARIPVKTKLVVPGDNLSDIVTDSLSGKLAHGDIVAISEKMVAVAQNRAYKFSEIKVSKAARFLAKFVHKSPHGIGLGTPETMQLAINEVGIIRIMFAALIAAVGKVLRIKGVFYIICGYKARSIDGPCHYTIPPYNEYAVLGPLKPDSVCKSLKELTGGDVVIIDANDLGVDVLGKSGKELSGKFIKEVFRDNPLGQGSQQTPIAIVREKTGADD